MYRPIFVKGMHTHTETHTYAHPYSLSHPLAYNKCNAKKLNRARYNSTGRPSQTDNETTAKSSILNINVCVHCVCYEFHNFFFVLFDLVWFCLVLCVHSYSFCSSMFLIDSFFAMRTMIHKLGLHIK